jgi:hypothetical protein
MGVWGFKALESDEAYDLILFLEENFSKNNKLELYKMISLLKENNYLGKNFEDIDAFYDKNAMAIGELYFEFKDNGKFSFPDKDITINSIKSFTADKSSLKYLLELLADLKNGIPENGKEREIIKFWHNSNVWGEWKNHINKLIERVEQEINQE